MDPNTTDNVSAGEHSGSGADTTTNRPGMDPLDPTTWDSQELLNFLQLNQYNAFVEPCRGLTGLQVVTLTEEAVKNMALDRSTLTSLVDLINYLKVLAWGASLDVKQDEQS